MHELPRPLAGYVEELLRERGLPGLALAVTDRERTLAVQGFGVDRKALFEIGSIGKTFTAVLTLLLREEGHLDVDAPVTDYLPWFEVGGGHGPIGLHHLLSHTAGLILGADQSSDSRFDSWALRHTEAGFPPGERFSYSNLGYRVLGHALEDLTGQRYPELVRERILEPLGLHGAEPAIASTMRPRLVPGHVRLYDDRPPLRHDPFVPATWLETSTADGCLALNAEDLASFLRVLLNRGGGLLSEDSFGLFTHPVRESEDGWHEGYGIEVREVQGRSELRHGGSMVGWSSLLHGDLTSGLGVTILLNGPDEEDVTELVAPVVLSHYRDGSPPGPPPDPLAVDDPGCYEGTYTGAPGRLVVRAEGDRLRLEAAGESTVLEPRRFGFLADLPRFRLFLLRFEGEGAPARVVHGGDVYSRGEQAEPEPELPSEWRPFPGLYRSHNPWLTAFRVVARGERLVCVYPVSGYEEELAPLGDGLFRAGESWSPERTRFDTVVDGVALRANLSGCDYYRAPGG